MINFTDPIVATRNAPTPSRRFRTDPAVSTTLPAIPTVPVNFSTVQEPPLKTNEWHDVTWNEPTSRRPCGVPAELQLFDVDPTRLNDCRDLSLSTGDLVDVIGDQDESAHEQEQCSLQPSEPSPSPVASFAWQVLPPPCFVGTFAPSRPGSRRPRQEDVLDSEKSVMLVNMLTSPVAEAFTATGLQCHKVFRLEEKTNKLSQALQSTFPSIDLETWMQALASDPVETPSIDWLVIRYPGPTISTNGKVDAELDDWIKKTGDFIQTMAKYCGLRAAAVLLPLRWPSSIDNLCTREMKSEGWCRRTDPLRNSDQTRADIRQLTTKQPTVRNNAFADHLGIPPFHTKM